MKMKLHWIPSAIECEAYAIWNQISEPHKISNDSIVITNINLVFMKFQLRRVFFVNIITLLQIMPHINFFLLQLVLFLLQLNAFCINSLKLLLCFFGFFLQRQWAVLSKEIKKLLAVKGEGLLCKTHVKCNKTLYLENATKQKMIGFNVENINMTYQATWHAKSGHAN